MRKLVKKEFGFWSGNVTAYRVLYSLQSAGLVKIELSDRRKYYSITSTGEEELEAAKAFLQSVLKSADKATK